jgi:ABC-type transporter MlaC component
MTVDGPSGPLTVLQDFDITSCLTALFPPPAANHHAKMAVTRSSLMFTQASRPSVAAPGLLLRRSLLGFVLTAAAPLHRRAFAATAAADATAVIEHFNEAFLAAMKTGDQTDFSHRFQALASEVDQAFDLPAVLAVSIGPGWASFPLDLQNRLQGAFRRYTVARYLANCGGYAGQSFIVSSDTRSVGGERVVVQSRIVSVGVTSG